MKKAWPLSRILLFLSVAITVVGVPVALIITHTAIGSPAQNIPLFMLILFIALILVLLFLHLYRPQARGADKAQVQYFKTALEYSSDAIGISDPRGRHWYQNKAFDELFGDIRQDPPASLYVDEKTGRQVFAGDNGPAKWRCAAETAPS